ncbi:hypothetical protein PVAND_009973 [Polypedilum vanderplanki]|uniref:C-type lectin domain-containing protein n=1 Tax=Polypedilum vanderplanki TaxID=319348 RepID=A0A9J6CE59_POLVA|nr:hypothetical protein PVAND_009973 [Polypedilum vanderplanki]
MKFLFKFFTIILIIFSDSLCNEIVFKKIGSYNILDTTTLKVTKNYYVPRYFKASWINAGLICNFYGMKFAQFDVAEEFESVRQMLKKYSDILTEWTHIDGITLTGKSTNDWYWSHIERKIRFPLRWKSGQPNFYKSKQWCLSLGSKTDKDFYFNDIECSGTAEHKFLCQNTDKSGRISPGDVPHPG